VLTFITFALISLLLGMVLGQRFKVLALVPVIAVWLPVATGIGFVRYGACGPTLLLVALAIAGLQIGYLAGVVIRYSLGGAPASGLRTAPIHGSQPTRHAAH